MATPPTTRKRHPIWARFYARISPTMDAQGALDHRRELLAGLAGRVLEVGAGNGLNFAHYPPAVTEVLAVEPEPYLRGLAEVAARQAPVSVRVVDGSADALPAADASMDAAVASLVLCSVPDQARALAELHRVLRPGGDLRFFEHVRADTVGLARVQRLADLSGPPSWAAVTPAATPWPPSPPPGSRSPASSGSGSLRAGCPNRPHPTSSGSPTVQPAPWPGTACARSLVSRNLY